MKKTVLTALLLAGIPAALAPVSAAAETPRRVTIAHADLDLSRVDHRARLDARIAHAVSGLCGTPSSADLAGQNAADACRASLTAQAVAQREAIYAQHRAGTVMAARR